MTVKLRGERGRRPAVLAVTALVALGGIVSHPEPASATRTITVEGRGFGHGRGMGQWGARGLAERGRDWRQILRHYYRGARLTRDGGGSIRVMVRGSSTVIIWSAGRSDALDHRGRRLASSTDRAKVFRARRSGSRILLERARRVDGPFRRVAATTGAIRFRPARRSLWVEQADGSLRAYDGIIQVRKKRDRLAAINVLPLDGYIAAVVPREMPASWPMEALRAQAVAARTYAARVRRQARASGAVFDICASTACQVYLGKGWMRRPGARVRRTDHPRSTRAVRDTARTILRSGGQPILAQYSSSTGGYTDEGSASYLRAVADPSDRISPHHSWSERVSVSHLEERWPEIGRFHRLRVTARNGKGTWGGRARRVLIEGSRGRVGVSGDTFAAVIGLRSDWFRFAPSNVRFERNLGVGMRDADVRRLQVRLRRAGFYPRSAPITDHFGSITRGAVRRYQRVRDIEPTGYVGPITRARLNGEHYRFRRTWRTSDEHPSIRELQHRLLEEGFYPRGAPRTGFLGSITRRALQRYQRAHGIRATGILGPQTRASLNRS